MPVSDEEARYEIIELTVKAREDGESWFEVLHDYITQDCQGTPYDEETDEDGDPCTCGLEMMSSSGGTLEQCYAWSTSLGRGVQPIHVARALVHMHKKLSDASIGVSEDTYDIVKWAESEIEFEEKWDNWTPEEDEE
jgi:hypothetical protein